MYQRLIEKRVKGALLDTPVVLIEGPRRAGKTTLVRNLRDAKQSYITLDDHTALAAARADPVGFIRGLDEVVIDEIQRAPELLIAIKKSVDEDYRPGRFLLTGSANVLTLPRVADSLAGRMETIQMLPLARVEVMGKMPSFLTLDVRLGKVAARSLQGVTERYKHGQNCKTKRAGRYPGDHLVTPESSRGGLKRGLKRPRGGVKISREVCKSSV